MTLFTARDGAVIFDGKPVPEFRAIAARHRLVTEALAPRTPWPVATAFWAARDQLVAALNASRAQRLTPTTNTAGRCETTVDSSQDGAVYVLGRES